jgi:protein-S-isoprenylcysteine O-methyltransferase Ste14
MGVADLLFMTGSAIAALLVSLLAHTTLFPKLRIWPTPGSGSWQSYVFWPLFRGLNVLCFAVALTDRTSFLALPAWMRAFAAIVLAVSVALFAHSFRVLGRDNSYGARDGLVTNGIYRWTRNPQNTMLVVVYGALAFAADSGRTYILCGAMMTVYILMVLLEEPWLVAAYGDRYQRYRGRVPRFFNWRRAALYMVTISRRPTRHRMAQPGAVHCKSSVRSTSP